MDYRNHCFRGDPRTDRHLAESLRFAVAVVEAAVKKAVAAAANDQILRFRARQLSRNDDRAELVAGK